MSKSAGAIFPSSRFTRVCIIPFVAWSWRPGWVVRAWRPSRHTEHKLGPGGLCLGCGRYSSCATPGTSAHVFCLAQGGKSSSQQESWEGGSLSLQSSRMRKLQLLMLAHSGQLLVKIILAHCQHLLADQRKGFSILLSLTWGKFCYSPGSEALGSLTRLCLHQTIHAHSGLHPLLHIHSLLGSPYLVGLAIFQTFSWLLSSGDLWSVIWECYALHLHKMNLIKL